MRKIAAAGQGLSVALIDEATAPGGQVFRAPAPGLELFAKYRDADSQAGDNLRRRVAEAAIAWRPGRRVWSASRGFRVDAIGPQGTEAFTAPQLIAATGAHERVIPFPGWTLPGVIGLAAATILIKSQGILPGQRLVVAGCGPLLALVAGKVISAGGEIAALVDLAAPTDWISAVPQMLRRFPLLRRGMGWVLSIGLARVPVYFRHTIAEAKGRERVERVLLRPVDRSGALIPVAPTEIGVDALIIGHGLVPGAELPRLLNARLEFDRRRGGWVPVLDRLMRTDVPGLFAVGDGAGISGAEPATLAGEIAGLTASLEAGRLSDAAHAHQTAALSRRLEGYRPFADAMADLMALRPGAVASIAPETIVCRCEDITRRAIEAAARDGALDVNQLKHFTRCGMGPCQGRMCGDVAAEILADTHGISRTAVGFWTGRPPLRPVALEDLVGAFSYDDIPIPKPAPL